MAAIQANDRGRRVALQLRSRSGRGLAAKPGGDVAGPSAKGVQEALWGKPCRLPSDDRSCHLAKHTVGSPRSSASLAYAHAPSQTVARTETQGSRLLSDTIVERPVPVTHLHVDHMAGHVRRRPVRLQRDSTTAADFQRRVPDLEPCSCSVSATPSCASPGDPRLYRH